MGEYRVLPRPVGDDPSESESAEALELASESAEAKLSPSWGSDPDAVAYGEDEAEDEAADVAEGTKFLPVESAGGLAVDGNVAAACEDESRWVGRAGVGRTPGSPRGRTAVSPSCP